MCIALRCLDIVVIISNHFLSFPIHSSFKPINRIDQPWSFIVPTKPKNKYAYMFIDIDADIDKILGWSKLNFKACSNISFYSYLKARGVEKLLREMSSVCLSLFKKYLLGFIYLSDDIYLSFLSSSSGIITITTAKNEKEWKNAYIDQHCTYYLKSMAILFPNKTIADQF